VDAREPEVSEADIERLSRNLGSLLAQSREARARGRDADLPTSPPRRAAVGIRRRPEFEDDLFLSPESPPRSAFAGGGR
jgi:hypothetical protein